MLLNLDFPQEAIAVGRSFASMKGYHLDGNKEMVAMGFMNIVGSLSSCYTATGELSILFYVQNLEYCHTNSDIVISYANNCYRFIFKDSCEFQCRM